MAKPDCITTISTSTNNSEDKMSHFLELLDDLEHRVEGYRDRALKLMEDGYVLAKSFEALESLPETLSAVGREEAEAHLNRVRSRLVAVNVNVALQRDQVQADAHSVDNRLGDIQQDSAATLQSNPTSNHRVIKKRIGRPRKSAVKEEPYVKTEILETPRQETSYSLRQKIKRKRFADEVSDPSDLEDEEKDDLGEESDMDFKAEDQEEEDEEDEEEEVEVDSEETNTDEGEESDKELEEHSFAIQLPADGAPELISDDLNPQAYYLVKIDSDGSVELISRESEALEDGVPFGLMCNSCDFVSVDEHELNHHMESCQGSKASSSLLKPSSARTATKATSFLQCEECPFASDSSRALSKHRKESHSREGKKRGGGVGGGVGGGSSGKQRVCKSCGKRFKTVSGLKKHTRRCGRSDPDVARSKVKCGECSAEFKREEDMQAHALIHYGQVTCPIHQILFKQESEVFQHANVAPANAKSPCLQCCMCDKQFRHMCIFMKHIRRHLRISPYRCGICHKHLMTYASLQLHQQRLHGGRASLAHLAVEVETEAEVQPIVLPVTPVTPVFTCKQCQKSFNTKGHLKEHVLGIHEKSEVCNCPVCSKTFNTKKRMKKHLFSSHKEVSEQFRRNAKLETFSDEGVAVQIILEDIE